MNSKVMEQAEKFATEATKVIFEPAYGAKYRATYQAVERRRFIVIREMICEVDYGHGKGFEFYGRDGVVCFIDKETGDVFKPQGPAPAKTKRYNIATEAGVNQMIANFKYGGNNGGFMYQDFKDVVV